MKVVKLTSEPRESSGSSGANRLRRAGRTPAVIYGEGTAPSHVSLPAHEFRMAVDAGARVIDLAGGSGEPERVLLTDVQFDAIGTKLLHADFRRMDPAHEITLRIPVIFEGALYATPALAGAVVAVLLGRTDLPVVIVAAAGFATCLAWRLLALVRGWSAPLPRGPANV